tara:strand:- start:2400 stop:3530 length:1131 start_codon:yes stop_codon:yes gene_type:complete
MRKPKVLIVYHYIALYREPIFHALSQADDSIYYFASCVKSNNDIKLIGKDSCVYDEKIFLELENIWLPKGFLWQKKLLTILDDNKFDRVIFLGDPHFISTWFALCKLRLMGTKTYLWTHGFVGRSNKFQDYLKLKMYSLCNGVLLYGEQAKKDLINAGVSASKLSVIYNSLDYEKQKKIRDTLTELELFNVKKKLFLNHSHLQLFFVGRLTKHKELGMLIDAVNKLKNKGVFINVLFIGDGEASDDLKGKVSNYSIEEQFNFYGSTHDEHELANLICSSDVCVAPGEVGLTAMHSLAYGVPVITHNNRLKQMPEYESVIHNETGLLFEYGSIDSLVDNIEKSITLIGVECKERCISIIESKYNPNTQVSLISDALR